MVVFKTLKRLIYQLDMFCSSELLRYNSETQYKTLTGGLLSLSIICVIVIGFANMIGDTLRRVTITSSLITHKQSNPTFASLVPGKQGMFMLGLSIQSIDLSFLANLTDTKQYFSLEMQVIEINNGVPNTSIVSLQPCTKQHWNMMPQFSSGFDSFGVSGWLCLPLNSPLPLQGTYTSPISYEILIQVFSCQNQTNNNSCASQEQIDNLFLQHGNFYLNLNYINPVINPNQQNFISYYIEGNDYVIFSSQIGSEAWVYFSDYTINSDDSIWPFTHPTTKSGCIVEQKAINHPYSASGNSSLASVFLARSVNSLIYKRQVQKISAVLSYIGGLVGAITAVLFLIKSYTDTSLELTIGINLFEQDKENDAKDQNIFNFFGFIRLTVYRLLKFCRWSGTSQRSERLQQYQAQALKQMDIELLLRRVIKLQTCMSHLFTPDELEEMREGQLITLESARKMRLLLLKDDQTEFEKNNKELNSDGFLIKNNQAAIIEPQPLSEGTSNAESYLAIHRDITPNDQIINKNQKQAHFDFKKQYNMSLKIRKNALTELKERQRQDNQIRIHPQNHIVLPPIHPIQHKIKFTPRHQITQ